MTDQPPLPPAVVDAFWQRWGSNTFLSAQGLELELAGVGRAVVHLRKPTVMQRGGGGSADVINGGVIAYMFDAALGCAIASAELKTTRATKRSASSENAVSTVGSVTRK